MQYEFLERSVPQCLAGRRAHHSGIRLSVKQAITRNSSSKKPYESCNIKVGPSQSRIAALTLIEELDDLPLTLFSLLTTAPASGSPASQSQDLLLMGGSMPPADKFLKVPSESRNEGVITKIHRGDSNKPCDLQKRGC